MELHFGKSVYQIEQLLSSSFQRHLQNLTCTYTKTILNQCMIEKCSMAILNIFLLYWKYCSSFTLFLVCRFRQYGLWEQYSVLYPENDLVYNVGTSNYSKDWFFAHVTRYVLYSLEFPIILVFEVIFIFVSKGRFNLVRQ